MNMLKNLAALLTLVVLTGCAAANVKPDLSVEQLVKTNKAVVVFSIVQPLDSEKYGDSLFRLTRTGESGSIHATSHDVMNPISGTPPSEFTDRYGRLATIELEPGEYQIDWMFSDGQGHFSLQGLPARNLIQVKAGEVLYVGELFIKLEFGETIFNIQRVFGAAGFLNDESARDIPLFEKKYPKLGKPEIRLFRTGPILNDTSNVLDAVK
jgi:hypothetical protein